MKAGLSGLISELGQHAGIYSVSKGDGYNEHTWVFAFASMTTGNALLLSTALCYYTSSHPSFLLPLEAVNN